MLLQQRQTQGLQLRACVQYKRLASTAVAPDDSMTRRILPAEDGCPTLQGHRRVEPPGPRWEAREAALRRAELERAGLPPPPPPYPPPPPLPARSTSAGRAGVPDLQPSDVPDHEPRLPSYLQHAMVSCVIPWCSGPALSAPCEPRELHLRPCWPRARVPGWHVCAAGPECCLLRLCAPFYPAPCPFRPLTFMCVELKAGCQAVLIDLVICRNC